MKIEIKTVRAPAAIGPYSQAVAAGGLLFTSGQIAINPETGVMPSGVEAQAKQVFENLKAILLEAGSSFDKVVKATVFLADMNDFAVVNTVYGLYFNNGILPARSAVQVAKLPKDALVEIEMIAEI
jgi:2-iminobutanoate/2-iminopropanoate deaminase